MIIPRNDEPLEEYKDYKNNKFETVKNKIKHILNGVYQTSLDIKDQKKLIKEIKLMVRKEF